METLLPAGLVDRLRKVHEPEQQLMAAILEDAVRVYCDLATRRVRRDRALRRKVETWLAREDALDPFAFVRICRELRLDPTWVRHLLPGWRTGDRAVGDATSRPVFMR